MNALSGISATPSLEPSLKTFLEELTAGRLRAARLNSEGIWEVNVSVKEKILEVFRQSPMISSASWPGFVDKEALMPQQFTVEHKVRMVPGGTAVRPGAYIAPNVVIMPPSYVNIGAYVGEGTMIDSHVLVGSCAQIGKNIHLSANVQIGGVLEPIGATPVIIEDDVFVGAGCQILDGICVRQGAVLAPGVTLSKSTEVIDLVHERALERGADIPPYAVVIPGSKAVNSSWGQAQGLQKYCALIVKYRDEKTSASVELEKALR